MLEQSTLGTKTLLGHSYFPRAFIYERCGLRELVIFGIQEILLPSHQKEVRGGWCWRAPLAAFEMRAK